jgi:ectoine hydroxylase-related dioxygenase (phytanoyl-CoA dioxygenase family)
VAANTIHYEIDTHVLAVRERIVDVEASPAEIDQLVREGYLVREGALAGDLLESLRGALDELIRGELDHADLQADSGFGGLFLRHLFDRSAAFHALLRFSPTLSVARAVLGPLVQIRALSARVTVGGEPGQETQWHVHQQVIPRPLPPFFCFPHGLDCLFYLDDVTDESGPLCVLPGSHVPGSPGLPDADFGDKDGQVMLHPVAGSCAIIHSNLWHRALPTQASVERRRVVILTYVPTWMRPGPYGARPDTRLTDGLLVEADDEIRELLGVGGFT